MRFPSVAPCGHEADLYPASGRYALPMIDPAFQGSLFSNDFLCDSIAGLSEWTTFDDAAANALAADLAGMFQRFPVAGRPNESQTEDDLIWAVLRRLGGRHSLRNQNLTLRGRDDVPHGLLFESAEAKALANGFHEEWKRYEFGLAIVESNAGGDRWIGSPAAAARKCALHPDAALPAAGGRHHRR